MKTLRGKGKLYDSRENYIDEITYEIYHKPTNNSVGEEWRGEITPGKGIMPVGNFIIELDDGRKGACTISMNTYSSFGLVVDSFSIEGTGPLIN